MTRLTDMGIEPYLISSTVAGVMAQRLLRVICPNCREPYHPKDATSLRNQITSTTSTTPPLYKGMGCENCLETGYLGRTGIFELMLVDHDVKNLIMEQRGPHFIKQVAIQKGMRTLRKDGVRRALEGITTLEEVYRVTQDSVRIHTGATSDVRG